MDLKSILIGGVIGLVVGGGAYGLYVKYGVKVATGEGDAISLMQQCEVLEANQPVSAGDAETFIAKVKTEAPQVFTALTVADAVAGQSGGTRSTAVQVDSILRQCVKNIQSSTLRQ